MAVAEAVMRASFLTRTQDTKARQLQFSGWLPPKITAVSQVELVA
jgi:hypothetical protein